MALHTPAHPLGTTHHPHTYRYALLAVIAAIIVVAFLVVADVVRIVPSSGAVVADKYLTPSMIEFRADERGAITGAVSAADHLLTPSLIEFRTGEHDAANPNEYNGPH